MASLIEKIEKHAAEKLTLPPGREPSQELARYKRFIKVETARLRMLHRAGAGGLQVCRSRSVMMDVLVRYLWQAVQGAKPLPPKVKLPAVALVATGGYGRGELNPFSDIDLMLLHGGDVDSRGKPPAFLENLSGEFNRLLWDVGLKVGYSFRRVEDCMMIANKDMQSKTSFLEARLIMGDEPLFKRMQAVILAKCVRGFEEAYLLARLEDQNTRRAKYGNSATMQEPNIKNGSGGLRDFQNLLWMAEFKYRAGSLEEMEKRKLATASERTKLEAAYDFLLQVRNELHYHFNRPGDILTKGVQPSIATALGHTDRSPVRRIESFMRDVYTHMRNIYLITRTLEQRLALLPLPGRRIPTFRDLIRSGRLRYKQQIIDGFKFVEGMILPVTPNVFKENSGRLMKVFLYAQQRNHVLHPDTAQLVRENLKLVDRGFLRSQAVCETFLQILNERGNVAPILRTMHETGLLGKYIPEFGRLTCLVQHEFYHRYTADEHTLVCIEKLDKVWQATEAPYANYADLFREVERPYVLYLALLLHDAGKADHKGKHTDVGGQLAVNVAQRLALDGAVTHTLRLMIENHLLMSQVSQRRDMDDISEIRNFAAKVITVENLILLTLHTFADTLGTSEDLWNDFKDTLLRTLQHKAREVLAGGTDFIRVEEKQRELLMQETARMLPPHLKEDELQAHFEALPYRYFQIHAAKEIVADLDRAHRFMELQMSDEEQNGLKPVVTWQDEKNRGFTAVHVCTWDRAGLLAKITGSLTAAGLNILSAQVFTRADGIILDSFYVTDAGTGLLVNREEREKFETFLSDALTGEIDLSALISRRKPRKTPYQFFEDSHLETSIHFDNSAANNRTVIDVETEDRLGLLYTISQVFSELTLGLSVAKICTDKGAAADSFYVAERDGGRITDPERQKFIEQKLLHAIAKLQ